MHDILDFPWYFFRGCSFVVVVVLCILVMASLTRRLPRQAGPVEVKTVKLSTTLISDETSRKEHAQQEQRQRQKPPPLTDFGDSRIVTFWLLTIGSTLSFVLWVVAATHVSHTSVRTRSQQVDSKTIMTTNSTSVLGFSPSPALDDALTLASSLKAENANVSIDIWFAVALTAALDAIAVVLTFNGLLIRRFHYAVSQRVMFVASAMSYGALQRHGLVGRHPLAAVVVGLGLYLLFDRALDRFELLVPTASLKAASRWGSLQRYSADLSIVEMSWPRASFLAACVGGFGLSLTMAVPSPWSALVPILHISFTL